VYAIFEDGGKQYKVSQGDQLLIELPALKDNQSEITFDRVLMLGTGVDAKIGTPWVPDATVTAKIVQAEKAKKVTGMKFLRRKGLRKKFGHRQNYLRVEITGIAG
jgi:large subunit ribosomal protein L21